MKVYTFAIALVATLSMSAHADLELTTCSSKNGKVKVIVATDYAGSIQDIPSGTGLPARGALRVLKLNKPTQGATIQLTGTVSVTAKGLYFELQQNDISIFIAAAASKSPSELTLAGKKFEVLCD